MSLEVPSLKTYFGVVMGKPDDMLPWANNNSAFFQKVLSDLEIEHQISLAVVAGTFWGEPEVTAGESGRYLCAADGMGHVVRFFGGGAGELHAIASGQRYIGAVTEASWAYVPAGVYYFYKGVSGTLACEGLAVRT